MTIIQEKKNAAQVLEKGSDLFWNKSCGLLIAMKGEPNV
jgi:hypothetical protein